METKTDTGLIPTLSVTAKRIPASQSSLGQQEDTLGAFEERLMHIFEFARQSREWAITAFVLACGIAVTHADTRTYSVNIDGSLYTRRLLFNRICIGIEPAGKQRVIVTFENIFKRSAQTNIVPLVTDTPQSTSVLLLIIGYILRISVGEDTDFVGDSLFKFGLSRTRIDFHHVHGHTHFNTVGKLHPHAPISIRERLDSQILDLGELLAGRLTLFQYAYSLVEIVENQIVNVLALFIGQRRSTFQITPVAKRSRAIEVDDFVALIGLDNQRHGTPFGFTQFGSVVNGIVRLCENLVIHRASQIIVGESIKRRQRTTESKSTLGSRPVSCIVVNTVRPVILILVRSPRAGRFVRIVDHERNSSFQLLLENSNIGSSRPLFVTVVHLLLLTDQPRILLLKLIAARSEQTY